MKRTSLILGLIATLLVAVNCKKEVIIDKDVDENNPDGITIIVDQETNVNVDNNAEVNVDGEEGDRDILERLCDGPVTISYMEVSKEEGSIYLEYKCMGPYGSDHSEHDHDEDESCPDYKID